MNTVLELQAQMLAAYKAWGEEPSADRYVVYVEAKNKLLEVLHQPLTEVTP